MNWQTLLSSHRLGGNEALDTLAARTAFQRDLDRIVFSSAFRRLQDKTQVFPLSRSDYVRTRLTHSLETSSVGRSLGTLVGEHIITKYRLIGIQSGDCGAIVAAACLAHDIGNPPFGHSGEDAIRHWIHQSPLAKEILASCTEGERADFTYFEGNAQGFRILTRLQNPDNRGGLQLTAATLAAFSKYPRESYLPYGQVVKDAGSKKHGFFQSERDLFCEIARMTSLQSLSSGAIHYCRHPFAFLVEAADDICYHIVDLEDGFRLKHLSYDEVYDLLSPMLPTASSRERLNLIGRPKERVEYLKARAINEAIRQTVDVFVQHEEAILQGEFHGELIEHIPSASVMAKMITVAEQKVYAAHEVAEIAAAGFEVIGGILDRLVEAVFHRATRQVVPAKSRTLIQLIPEHCLRVPETGLYEQLLGITDYLSGMTDSYAVSFYKKMTGISLPGK